MSKYREGFVKEIDEAAARVRVEFPERGVVSPWLRVLVTASKTHQDARAFVLDEFVAVMLDEHEESGCVLGALYTDDNTPPALEGAARRVTFGDGVSCSYDAESHTLTIAGEGLNVVVNGSVKVGEGAHQAAAADKVIDALTALKDAIANAVPIPMDGGVGLQAAIVLALAAWPPSVSVERLTSD